MTLYFRPLLVGVSIAAIGLMGCGSESPEALIASGERYLAQNDPKAASIQLKNALQTNPNSAQARYLLGKAMLVAEDPASASVELRKAHELKYPADELVPVLAKALLLQGQAKKVTDEYASTVLGTPEAIASLKTTLALAYLSQGKREESQAALSEALNVLPDHVPALIFQARLMAGRQDTEGAFKLLDKVLAKAPGDPESWLLKGDLLQLLRNEPEAVIEAYRKSLSLRETMAAHSAIIAQELARNELNAAKAQLEALKKVRPNHAQTKFFEAQLAFQRGDYKVAKEAVDQLLKIGSDSPRLLQLAGGVAFQTGSLLQAEQYLNKALQLAPDLLLARQVLSQTYSRMGQPAKALRTLEPALQSAEPSSETLSLAGAAHLQAGDNEKARQFFTRAIKANPNDVRARAALAMSRLTGDQSDQPLAELATIAASDPGTIADMALISASVGRKDAAGALKAIERLEKKQPDKAFVPNLRGKVLLLAGDAKGARKSFERALTLDPLYFPAAESLAVLDVNDNRADAAEQRFGAILKQQPDSVPALLAIAQLRMRAGRPEEEIVELLAKAVKINPTDPTARLLLIEYRLGKRDFKRALDAAQQAASTLPDSPQILEALARSQLAAGDYNQAVTSFGKVASLHPDSPQAHLELADAYVAAGKRGAALESLNRALAIAPQFLPAQQKSIALNLAAGNAKEALTIARTIQAQRPASSIGLAYEGDIEASSKNWGRASAAYRSALEKEGSTRVAEKLHATLIADGKRAEAQAMSDHWLKEHPQDALFILYRGNVALTEQRYEAAHAEFERVVKMQPENPAALNNLAWTMAKLGKPGALVYAERANKLLPDQPALMDTWAMILANENKLGQAIEIEQKAVALQPQNSELRLALAKMYVKAGDKAQARKELDLLARLGEKFPGQREVLQLREQL